MCVRHIIDQQMAVLGISVRGLASLCNFKDRKKISNYIKGKSELNFYAMIKICKVLFKENPYDVLNLYALEVKRLVNIKTALEYCSMNRQLDIGDKLLDKLKDMTNPKKKNYLSIMEWVEVYQLLFGRVKIKQSDGSLKSKIGPEEVLTKLKEIKVKPPELKILLQLLQSYVYQDQEKYDFCYASFDGITDEIKKIKSSEYFKISLEIRFKELAGYICLHVFGDFETCRSYSKELIANSEVEIGYKATAHYNLGTSYMFESLDKAIYHFHQSLDLLKGTTRSDTHIKDYLIPLTYIIHNKFSKVKTQDKSLLAYLYIKTNDCKEGLRILESFITENGEKTAFTQFVKGLATMDIELLSDSMSLYENKRDMVFIHLPRISLKGLGLPECLIDDRIKYKIKSFKGVDEFEKSSFRNISSINGFRHKREYG
ncbi:hypothetical protein IHV10_20375 [Fictibacillus sp. 5RED26]|uniref:AimR family lysis-lysogeny pheromone receptor n=1 Tax=Fictibacillus sp. 5RED26 TaxID=2745876 RepID=UPI0018CCACC3|nr:hypothetical protein [Fictibacillus sp. 5RED26]